MKMKDLDEEFKAIEKDTEALHIRKTKPNMI